MTPRRSVRPRAKPEHQHGPTSREAPGQAICLAAWVGLVLRQFSSGDRKVLMGISKRAGTNTCPVCSSMAPARSCERRPARPISTTSGLPSFGSGAASTANTGHSSRLAESGRLVRRMSHRVDPAAIAEEARTVPVHAVLGPLRRSVPVGDSSTPESRTLLLYSGGGGQAWDQQEETEQSDSRTDRGRAIDTRVQSELVSSIVPRGTS